MLDAAKSRTPWPTDATGMQLRLNGASVIHQEIAGAGFGVVGRASPTKLDCSAHYNYDFEVVTTFFEFVAPGRV